MNNTGYFLLIFVVLGLFGLLKAAEFQFYNQPKWLDGESVQYVLFDSTANVSLRNVQKLAIGIYGEDKNGNIIPGYLSDLCRLNVSVRPHPARRAGNR